MRRRAFVLLFALATAAASLTGAFPPRAAAQASSNCFPVDCNVCCWISPGRLVCTEIACHVPVD